MSTQNRGSGGSRNQKKSNSVSGSGGGDANVQVAPKKTDASKTEKEKFHPKPTPEQLRIAQITNGNTAEDPQMREKVATLIEMTQRSEEEVCCALYECDNNLERAVVFLLETLPVGAFETSSKKKKNKAATAVENNVSGEGEWTDANANTEKREKSRNRSSNRGGRGGTDSRGWRGREARDNERNSRGDRVSDERNDNYRGGQRNGGGRSGGSRGGGYASRSGRGGGRMGGRGSGGRGERGGGYSSRHNANEDHHEVELWDNTIAQNAEKQNSQTQDEWGDWDNEEYVGSLKDSKVFTTSNLPSVATTAASVVSGTVGNVSSDLGAHTALDHHLSPGVLSGTTPQQQGSHLSALVGNAATASTSFVDDTTSTPGGQTSASTATTPLMQYSAAVSNTPPQQQQTALSSSATGSLTASTLTSSQYNNSSDTFSSAATAAANLVQQVQQQQQQPPIKASATLSAEQSQYFNSLSSQNSAAANVQQQQIAAYTQTTGVPYPASYANVFGSAATGNAVSNVASDQAQLPSGQQPQARRTRAKIPPPSKIPSSAVEMPGDTLNNIGYLDVQFGGLDFGTDDSFDTLSDKFNNSVTIDGQPQQQQQQQLTQTQQDVGNEYQGDSLSTGYAQRSATQPQQVVANVSAANTTTVVAGSNALEQLTKSDPYNQANAATATAYQSTYQPNTTTNKVAYQQTTTAQAYSASNYANVQSSVSNAYQPQNYGSYQQNSVNSYPQQQPTGSTQNLTNSIASSNVSGSGNSTQNIPNSNSSNNANANSNAGFLTSGYQSQQSAYQSNQSVYGNTGLSNNTGPSTNSTVNSSGTAVSSGTSSTVNSSAANTNNASSSSSNTSSSTIAAISSSNTNSNSTNSSSTSGSGSGGGSSSNNTSAVVAAAAAVSSASKNSTSGGMVPNIQMQGYYDLNYTPTSLGAGRDSLGSVAYSTMTDGRFARTDNNSSPVSNVSNTMSQQQAGSSGPMLNVPYAYIYGGNMMPGSFQYGTPAIYPQQIPAANTASGGQFPKPSYNTGYGSTSYDALSQASQDYSKSAYPSTVNQQTKSQNVTNPPQAGTGSDITSSMYGKGHVALNKVNSYEKQNFHSGTPPPFNMPNTQTAGGTSAQPYGMYLPMPAAGHHNMIHQPIHQMDGRIHSSSRRDSNSTGQRQQLNSQSKSATKQGYSPSYWTGQN